MPQFSRASREKVLTCTQELQDILNEAINHFDFTVVHGYRDKAQQDLAFARGKSKNSWPTSNHNKNPSKAADIVPYPEGYQASWERFYEMATYVLAAASERGLRVRWGGHWKNYTGKGKYDRDWSHFEYYDNANN